MSVVSAPNQPVGIADTLIFNDNVLQVYGTREQPLFKPRQACEFLMIVNYRDAILKLDDDEKVQRTLKDANGRAQLYTLITRPGLVALAQQSRKPEAAAFRRWLRHTVLEDIFTTGSFSLKRKREDDLERINTELAIWDRIGGLDPRDRIAYQDRMRALSGPVAITAEPSTEEIPITLWMSRNGIKGQSRGFPIACDRAIAKAYVAHYGVKPVTRVQWCSAPH